MEKPIILRAGECEVIEKEWGQLTWFASGALGNSKDMTVGQCILKIGMQNPKHAHPNYHSYRWRRPYGLSTNRGPSKEKRGKQIVDN